MTKAQEVTIDFLEIDHIRQSIKDAAKLFGFKPIRRAKSFYAKSSFYIGRSISVLKITDIRDERLTHKVAQYVAAQYPEYEFHSTSFGQIFIYLRGADNRRILI